MEHRTNPIQIALRVMTSISEKRRPEDVDVRALELFMGLKPTGMSLDDYTSSALRKAIEDVHGVHLALAELVSRRAGSSGAPNPVTDMPQILPLFPSRE